MSKKEYNTVPQASVPRVSATTGKQLYPQLSNPLQSFKPTPKSISTSVRNPTSLLPPYSNSTPLANPITPKIPLPTFQPVGLPSNNSTITTTAIPMNPLNRSQGNPSSPPLFTSAESVVNNFPFINEDLNGLDTNQFFETQGQS